MINKKRNFYSNKLWFLFLIILLIFNSCKKTDVNYHDSKSNIKRLVIAYLIADNNLDYFAVQNINEMEKGFDSAAFNGKLLVFIDRARNAIPSHPYMMEIVHDTTDAIVSKIIYTYPEQNVSQYNTLTAVIQDAKNHYPSFTNTGLILWSHGSAWIPKGVDIGTKRGELIDSVKSFGMDNTPIDNSVMDIKELATGLRNSHTHFDFILFDACYMSSIEVASELKDVSDYMIASPTEILSYGFPYKSTIPLLGATDLDYKAVSDNYFNSYQSQKGILQTGSIATINLKNISNLTDKIQVLYNKYSQIKDTCKINIHNIQRLDYSGDSTSVAWAFDLKNLLQYNFESSNDIQIQQAYNNMLNSWNNTIMYSRHTNMLFNTINLNNCNGISTYIPNSLKNIKADEYYKTLSWYQQSGYDKIIFSPNY